MSAFFNLRTVTTTDTSTLEDIAATLSRNYPHLTINSVPKTRTEWIVVHRPDMIIFSPDHPPTYDPHMTLTMDSDKVLYDFRALSQSIDKGLFNWAITEQHLNTLLPHTSYTLCPGIKGYPSSVHFNSTHHVHMSLPYERHQSDTCKLWHIPKNRQAQPESKLYDVCDSCKVFHNRLEMLRKRHDEISPSKRDSWKHPSSHRPLKYCSPRTGICIIFITWHRVYTGF